MTLQVEVRPRQRSPTAIGASWEVESDFTPQKRDGHRLVQWRFLNNERKAKSRRCDIFAIVGNGAHINQMAKPQGAITLDLRPVKFGSQWHVVGTYPSGQQEHITGFKTEASALDWIANDSVAWLERQRVR